MSGRGKKTHGKAAREPEGTPPADRAEDQLRAGMPATDSVRDIITFTSPNKRTYRIIKTDEQDAYDAPAKPRKRGKRRSDSGA